MSGLGLGGGFVTFVSRLGVPGRVVLGSVCGGRLLAVVLFGGRGGLRVGIVGGECVLGCVYVRGCACEFWLVLGFGAMWILASWVGGGDVWAYYGGCLWILGWFLSWCELCGVAEFCLVWRCILGVQLACLRRVAQYREGGSSVWGFRRRR